jgi:DNA-binding transcriptional ArsR family regulator
MTVEFDADRFKLSPLMRGQPVIRNRLPRHKAGERFLKGPIPWNWLQSAAGLPGRALHIGVLLWQKAGCEKSGKIKFCLAHAKDLGLSPSAARRSLSALEKAGLVTVSRPVGRSMVVIIHEFKPHGPVNLDDTNVGW